MKTRGQLLAEIEAMDCPIITAEQAAPIIGTDANSLRRQAHERPETLHFPVTVIGTRVKIPRVPFVDYLNGRGTQETACQGLTPETLEEAAKTLLAIAEKLRTASTETQA